MMRVNGLPNETLLYLESHHTPAADVKVTSYDVKMTSSDDANNNTKPAEDVPAKSEISRRFSELVANLNLPGEYAEQLNKDASLDYKWNLLQSQESVVEGRHTVAFYMNQLTRHLDPALRAKNPPKKLLKALSPIETLLTSLEIDIRSNPNNLWLQDFIDEPNWGHVLLLRLLKLLQDQSNRSNTTTTSAHTGGSKGGSHHAEKTGTLGAGGSSGKTKKDSQQQPAKDPVSEEHLCLLCIKAIVKNKYGFVRVLSAPRSLSIICWCLRLAVSKTRIVVLKILSQALVHAGGFGKCLQAFEDFKLKKPESCRFESLVHSVIFCGRLNTPAYQEQVLNFFNKMIAHAPSMNQRVFHQHEFQLAGFSADKAELSLDIDSRTAAILEELDTWRKNYIDVASTYHQFLTLKTKSTSLQDDVNVLQVKIEEMNEDKFQVESERQQLSEKVESLKQMTCDLQSSIVLLKQQQLEFERNKTNKIIESSTTVEVKVVADITMSKTETITVSTTEPTKTSTHVVPPKDDVIKQTDDVMNTTDDVIKTTDDVKNIADDVINTPTDVNNNNTPTDVIMSPSQSAMPPPPPPPPPPPMVGLLEKKLDFITSKKRLPLFNWVPVKTPSKESIFSELNPTDQAITDELDFQEFENTFQLQKTAVSPMHCKSREATMQRLSSQTTVFDSSKSRRILIAKKKIALQMSQLQAAISACDVQALKADTSELLLKSMPTEEERKSLERHSEESSDMAEADRFILQLSQIEGLENKLKVLHFMGTFTEHINTITPQIEAIITASESVTNSQKFKRLIEIILAFGNFINGKRRGYTKAFKLQSLSKLEDLKTVDKKTSFLNYLVITVKKKFPEVHTFHRELQVKSALNVSTITLSADVAHVQRGLEAARTESESQLQNAPLRVFYAQAAQSVSRIAEQFSVMQQSFARVCDTFCEDAKLTEPSEFFSNIYQFVEAYARVEREEMRKNAPKPQQTRQIRETSALNGRLVAELALKRKSVDLSRLLDSEMEFMDANRTYSMPAASLKNFLSVNDVRSIGKV